MDTPTTPPTTTKVKAPGRRPRHPRPARLPRVRLAAGLLPGLFAALVVAGLGVAYVGRQPVQYSASNQLLIAPRTGQQSAATASSYWQTLGNGQVPATAAAIVDDKRLLTAATVNIDPATRRAIATTVSVVPSTAVINVQVTAPTPSVAEDVANSISRKSTTEVSSVLAPYKFKVISDATGTAKLTSMSHGEWGGLVGLVALFAGVAVQQLVAWRSRRRGPPVVAEALRHR